MPYANDDLWASFAAINLLRLEMQFLLTPYKAIITGSQEGEGMRELTFDFEEFEIL